jgi:CxC2 like cysteine cluster associated with KDZ transposases
MNPDPAIGDDFVVIDNNGIHQVGVDYCSCETALPEVEQVLRARWYPATSITPKTAATFNALEYFHLLTFESKASVFEYIKTLMRRMDNTGTVKVPVC